MVYPATNDVKRKLTMSRIKSKNTSIEVSLRRALWRAGIRYRKNCSKLPGTPDIVITKHRVAIFVDGEFWHGKDWESKKHKIKSNRDYWVQKIERNIARDNEVNRKLCSEGWTVLRYWGNEIHNDVDGCVQDIIDTIFQNELGTCCYDYCDYC
jgi:DNA mismatch endonuclease (patch repair protein)